MKKTLITITSVLALFSFEGVCKGNNSSADTRRNFAQNLHNMEHNAYHDYLGKKGKTNTLHHIIKTRLLAKEGSCHSQLVNLLKAERKTVNNARNFNNQLERDVINRLSNTQKDVEKCIDDTFAAAKKLYATVTADLNVNSIAKLEKKDAIKRI